MDKFGFYPVNIKKGVVFRPVITAYVHNSFGRLVSMNMYLAMLNKVRKFFSAVPFWSGEYGAGDSCLMPFLLSKAWNSFPVNSVTLSVLKHSALP